MSDRGWRSIERDLVDFFRCRGHRFRDICGAPHVEHEFIDDESGQVVARAFTNLEELARALAEREMAL